MFQAIAHVAVLARDKTVNGQQYLIPYFPIWFKSKASLIKTVSKIFFSQLIHRTRSTISTSLPT